MSDFPTLSLSERDRRYALLREAMARAALDGLVVFGMRSRERISGYLANEHIEGAVILTRDREPVQVFPSAQGYSRRMAGNFTGTEFWIDRYLAGPLSLRIPQALRDEGLENSRVGVVGIHNTFGPGEAEGFVPYGLWVKITQALPDVEFVDATDLLQTVMVNRSAEEIVMIRHAAGIAEKACQTMLDVTAPGVTEAEIFAEVCHTIHRLGGYTTHPRMAFSLGANDVGWTAPSWFFHGGRTRQVEAGSLVQAEIFATYGGFECQAQMSVAIEPVPAVLHELAAVARDSYDCGLEALRSGKNFAEIDLAMKEPVLRAGCYTLGPQIHTLSPTRLSGEAGIGAGPDCHPAFSGFASGKAPAPQPVPTGALFAFQPNASRGNNRVNIGGAVLVDADGVHELSTLPCSMNVKK